MSASVTWSGLEDYKAALRSLPSDLAGEGADIVERRATGAVETIRDGYPSRSDDLRKKLTVEHTRTPFGARSTVRNTSPHALPFEIGSQTARHTSKGWNRGTMPANPLFSRTIVRERRAMYAVDFRDLLTRHGLLVSGEA